MCEPLGQQCKIIIFIAPYLGRSALYIRLVKVYSFLQAYSIAFCWIPNDHLGGVFEAIWWGANQGRGARCRSGKDHGKNDSDYGLRMKN